MRDGSVRFVPFFFFALLTIVSKPKKKERKAWDVEVFAIKVLQFEYVKQNAFHLEVHDSDAFDDGVVVGQGISLCHYKTKEKEVSLLFRRCVITKFAGFLA